MLSRLILSIIIILSILSPATADSIRDYCKKEMAEIVDYCVEQERAAQERIETGNPDHIILSVCRETFPESFAMQEACITIKQDYERGLRPVKPGENI